MCFVLPWTYVKICSRLVSIKGLPKSIHIKKATRLGWPLMLGPVFAAGFVWDAKLGAVLVYGTAGDWDAHGGKAVA